ncbi:MAG: hypothetical protein C0518_16060 [Opitutus sp.]|nr:hypothetical protein [Opitutus sp.]
MIFRLSFFCPPRESGRRWLVHPGILGLATPASAGDAAGMTRRVLVAGILFALCGLLTSCPAGRPPGALGVLQQVTVPARVLGNLFLIEARVDGRGPFQFLIDTGSSISLVSERVARSGAPRDGSLTIRNARGETTTLPRVTLPRTAIGDASFADVPAGVHEFGEISAQLGVPVDGVLGLPVFRDVLLTLDYPAGRLVLDASAVIDANAQPTLRAFYGAGVPLTMVRVAGRETAALLDSGSDGSLAINAASGAELAAPPRAGAVRATLAGDYQQRVGRLTSDLEIGTHAVREPIVEVTEGIPSIGGEILRNFRVTFDQRHELVALQRAAAATGPLRPASQRSVGLSFFRDQAAWRVATVIADTPAAGLPIHPGDVCVSINGEPVAGWPIDRFNGLLRAADHITVSLAGPQGEREIVLPVIDLVP